MTRVGGPSPSLARLRAWDRARKIEPRTGKYLAILRPLSPRLAGHREALLRTVTQISDHSKSPHQDAEVTRVPLRTSYRLLTPAPPLYCPSVSNVWKDDFVVEASSCEEKSP